MPHATNPLTPFHGGLRLPSHKEHSRNEPIVPMPLCEHYYLPVQEHLGEADEVIVQVGQTVLKGQILAEGRGYISAPLHAPTSGVIRDIGAYPVPHPSGRKALTLILEADGEDRSIDRHPLGLPTALTLPPREIRQRVRQAGVVGLGGATFPTAVKLEPGNPIHTLILNGAECEPYITCDDRLMRERAEQILFGAQILLHALGAERCLVGVEDDKPEAMQALEEALQGNPDERVRLILVPTRYPSGGERQLIHLLTGQEVPSGGLPADLGMVCQNVGTAVAVYRAVALDEPLISRIVTVTGGGVVRAGNLEVRLGTPIRDLIQHQGGYSEQAARLILGGPMMGFTLADDGIPVVKASNCILVESRDEAPPPQPEMPCIRCGECVQVCPARLLPQQLYWYSRARDMDRAQDYNLFDCIECGCCSYVCPSHIPLVQYYRYAKTEIWNQEQERRRADIARRRHEARQARLEREKQERAERMRKKKAALGRAPKGGKDPKKAAIEAAVERAKARRAQDRDTPPKPSVVED